MGITLEDYKKQVARLTAYLLGCHGLDPENSEEALVMQQALFDELERKIK